MISLCTHAHAQTQTERTKYLLSNFRFKLCVLHDRSERRKKKCAKCVFLFEMSLYSEKIRLVRFALPMYRFQKSMARATNAICSHRSRSVLRTLSTHMNEGKVFSFVFVFFFNLASRQSSTAITGVVAMPLSAMPSSFLVDVRAALKQTNERLYAPAF